MITARIIGNRVEIAADYRPSWVKRVKQIGARFRSWDAARKIWSFDRAVSGRVCVITHDTFDTCLGLCEPERPSRPQPEPVIDARWRVLWLLPGAPVEVVKAVRQALALIHHPDRGGDLSKMQTINAAADWAMSQTGGRR